MLLWCAKAVCSIVLAVLQASLTYEHIQLSLQVCHFVAVAVLLIAVLHLLLGLQLRFSTVKLIAT